jgi:hypothetical protein
VWTKIGADLFRYLLNCLVDRAAFPIFLVKPKPVSGHKTLASPKEVRSPAERPVACFDATDMNLARLPPLFIRQNCLGRSPEADLLCGFYRAERTDKSRKLRLLSIRILVIFVMVTVSIRGSCHWV